MNYWTKVLNKRVGRRRYLALLGGGAAASAILAACGSDDSNSDAGGTGSSSSPSGGSSGPSSSPESASNEEIKRGGTLRIGYPNNIVAADPHINTGGNRHILYQPYDTLTQHDAQSKPGPSLVSSWELADGGATLVFKLRQDVTYHSGRPFSSDDVLWNFERVGDAEGPFALYKELASWFPTIEAQDQYTVVLKSDRPRPAVFDYMESFVIADKETLSETTFIGTGPWKWAEWRQGESVRLERNPNYWVKDTPYLDELTWQITLDGETALAHLEADALDVVNSPNIPAFLRFQGNSGYQTMLDLGKTNAMHTLGINVRNKPFDDNRVRQAFNWAIDRERFVDLIMGGIVEVGCLPWSKTSVAYNEDQQKYYSFDLEEATKLLNAAGASDISTSVVYRPGDLVDFLPIYQSDLKSIGVELNLNAMDQAAFAQAVNGRDFRDLYAGNTGNSSISAPFTVFFTSASLTGDGDNHFGFVNDRFVTLAEEASIELDIERQRAIYREINQILLDSGHLMMLSQNPNRQILSSSVNGAAFNFSEEFDYSTAWLA